MEIQTDNHSYGLEARNRIADAVDPGLAGARAALETFYYALNSRDLRTLTAVWQDDALVQLSNPLGGMLRGRDGVRALYERVFDGAGRVQVTFSDIVSYTTDDVAVFAGRERGSFTHADQELPLEIRTTRVLSRTPDGWRMVHHHGSIDDATALSSYQTAVQSAAR